jgi:hypothetical protein
MAKTGLDNRDRENNGQIREKNGATQIGTLRGTYGENFAQGHRADMKLDTLLRQTNSSSLTDYRRKQK